VDGKGHLFVASNSGGLLFADYDVSGLIGVGFNTEPFLSGSLDDIAPLSSLGSQRVPEPTSLAIFGSALFGFGLFRHQRARP
jgi:hypothetical protein